MNVIHQSLLLKWWWSTDIFQEMSVIDKHFSRNVGHSQTFLRNVRHWQTFSEKCWSLTDIFQQMLVSRGTKNSQRAMSIKNTACPVRTHKQRQTHTFHAKGEKKCSTWLSFMSGQTNIIDQHLEQKCGSMTDIFQEMLVTRGSENSRGLIERRVRPTKRSQTQTLKEKHS